MFICYFVFYILRPFGPLCYHVFYYFCLLCHYGFCIILSVIITSVHYVIMASVHSVCHYDFCIILSVIMTSVPYVIMASASFCLSSWLLSLMSLRLLFPCYFVFYILCPLCLPFILSGLEGLLCKVFLLTY